MLSLYRRFIEKNRSRSTGESCIPSNKWGFIVFGASAVVLLVVAAEGVVGLSGEQPAQTIAAMIVK